jgi:hypothetical protein
VRPSNKTFAILVAALAGGFIYGLWKLYDLRFAAGDIYPPYSSLRADPIGSKALFESILQLPGASADRNYLPLKNAPKGNATLLFLGQDPYTFEASPEDRLKELEGIAHSGARVVIAMLPLLSRKENDTPVIKNDPHEAPEILKRWGVGFGYITRRSNEDEALVTGIPKQTAVYFRYKNATVHRLELPFGNGVIVLLANSYPLSNEALAVDRDADLLAWTIGGNRHVIFDEHHLGITESGGIVTLARKYHLEGLAAALLLLLGLFIWKNSTSLLPTRELSETEDGVEAKDISAGLANLLRRNIPRKQLLRVCLKEWENSRHGGRYYSPVKLERVRKLARQEGDAAATYRMMSKILTERIDR